MLEDIGDRCSEVDEDDLRCHENFEAIEKYLLNRKSDSHLELISGQSKTLSSKEEEETSRVEEDLECLENFDDIEGAIENPELECMEDFEEIEKTIELQLAAESSQSTDDQILKYQKKVKFLTEKCSQLKEKSEYLSMYLQESVDRGKEVRIFDYTLTKINSLKFNLSY